MYKLVPLMTLLACTTEPFDHRMMQDQTVRLLVTGATDQAPIRGAIAGVRTTAPNGSDAWLGRAPTNVDGGAELYLTVPSSHTHPVLVVFHPDYAITRLPLDNWQGEWVLNEVSLQSR